MQYTMKNKELIQKFMANGYYLKAAEIAELGIGSRTINRMIQDGLIERVRFGYYRLLNENNDMSETRLIAKLFPDGIICMYSALFYYGYSNRTPLEWDIAISNNVSRTRFKIDYPFIKPYFMPARYLKFGVTTAEYPDCNLPIFDKDRLICECLKFESKMDKETINSAIQSYIADPQKNIAKLLEFAKLRRTYEKVKTMIGIWL